MVIQKNKNIYYHCLDHSNNPRTTHCSIVHYLLIQYALSAIPVCNYYVSKLHH